MAARGRRRRTRGLWFPTLGTSTTGEFPQDNVNGRLLTIAHVDNSIRTLITPLTFDEPKEGDQFTTAQETSLSDIIGSAYILDRILGKCFIERQPILLGGDTDDNPAVLVGAGFFVARAEDSGAGAGPFEPIGARTEAERRDNYSPLEVDTIREPWIWRRTWILGASVWPPYIVAGSQRWAAYPPSTAAYGSVMDGPHIDAKSKRLITGDNRLWFALSAVPYPFGGLGFAGFTTRCYLDYRLIGRLRRARNQSAF